MTAMVKRSNDSNYLGLHDGALVCFSPLKETVTLITCHWFILEGYGTVKCFGYHWHISGPQIIF